MKTSISRCWCLLPLVVTCCWSPTAGAAEFDVLVEAAPDPGQPGRLNVPGAWVSLTGSDGSVTLGSTDLGGIAPLGSIPAGSYRLEVYYRGESFVADDVPIAEGDTTFVYRVVFDGLTRDDDWDQELKTLFGDIFDAAYAELPTVAPRFDCVDLGCGCNTPAPPCVGSPGRYASQGSCEADNGGWECGFNDIDGGWYRTKRLPPPPVDDAAFVSQSVPTQMVARRT